MQSRVCYLAKEKTTIKYCIAWRPHLSGVNWMNFLDVEALIGSVLGQMAIFLVEICFEGEVLITWRGRATKEGPGRLCLVNDQQPLRLVGMEVKCSGSGTLRLALEESSKCQDVVNAEL